jgi:hypothetical protein
MFDVRAQHGGAFARPRYVFDAHSTQHANLRIVASLAGKLD